MSIIKLDNIDFSYSRFDQESDERKQVKVLKDISLQIEEGDFVAILGHNGSGKSTLAKIINALLIPDKGKAIINGKDSSVEENIWGIRQSVGMVFQNPDNQIIATIVEEDVAFGPENLGVPPSEIRERVEKSLDQVRMGGFEKRIPSLLSGGQKQRIAIAGVLAMKPKCIIFDESTAMLDPMGREEVMEIATRLNKEEGITVILITHYMEEAVKANRVIVMNEGIIEMDGTPKDVFMQVEKVKSLSLDVPQITELCYNLKKEGFDIEEGVLSIEKMVEIICNYN